MEDLRKSAVAQNAHPQDAYLNTDSAQDPHPFKGKSFLEEQEHIQEMRKKDPTYDHRKPEDKLFWESILNLDLKPKEGQKRFGGAETDALEEIEKTKIIRKFVRTYP